VDKLLPPIDDKSNVTVLIVPVADAVTENESTVEI
jgi:hypothetical protein